MRPMLGLTLILLAGGCARPYPSIGLRPVPVLMMGGWAPDPILRRADDLQPTLRWETFPRPVDAPAVSNISYELRIWRAEKNQDAPGQGLVLPGELVYARAGLVEPVHRVETPLEPDTLYLWSIRARFELEGRVRVTDWGALMFPRPFPTWLIPARGYYPIKTPSGTVRHGPAA
ncbi:MAG TPA: hypothetical protein VL086_14115 [Candidatus Nitrosotalea sp.]|jgi:hypothetical protein|nr:hypothetical protein [Candidatus Nitrosotalea sp.]